MAAHVKHSAEAPERRPADVKRTIRIDQGLYSQVTALAKRRHTTIRALLESALLHIITADAAGQNDATLGPLLDRVIHDRHKRLEGGLRNMMARVAYEVLRNQYVLLNFIAEAGISAGRVDSWREQGWHFAVKEFKQQPDAAKRGPDEED